MSRMWIVFIVFTWLPFVSTLEIIRENITLTTSRPGEFFNSTESKDEAEQNTTEPDDAGEVGAGDLVTHCAHFWYQLTHHTTSTLYAVAREYGSGITKWMETQVSVFLNGFSEEVDNKEDEDTALTTNSTPSSVGGAGRDHYSLSGLYLPRQ